MLCLHGLTFKTLNALVACHVDVALSSKALRIELEIICVTFVTCICLSFVTCLVMVTNDCV